MFKINLGVELQNSAEPQQEEISQTVPGMAPTLRHIVERFVAGDSLERDGDYDDFETEADEWLTYDDEPDELFRQVKFMAQKRDQDEKTAKAERMRKEKKLAAQNPTPTPPPTKQEPATPSPTTP